MEIGLLLDLHPLVQLLALVFQNKLCVHQVTFALQQQFHMSLGVQQLLRNMLELLELGLEVRIGAVQPQKCLVFSGLCGILLFDPVKGYCGSGADFFQDTGKILLQDAVFPAELTQKRRFGYGIMKTGKDLLCNGFACLFGKSSAREVQPVSFIQYVVAYPAGTAVDIIAIYRDVQTHAVLHGFADGDDGVILQQDLGRDQNGPVTQTVNIHGDILAAKNVFGFLYLVGQMVGNDGDFSQSGFRGGAAALKIFLRNIVGENNTKVFPNVFRQILLHCLIAVGDAQRQQVGIGGRCFQRLEGREGTEYHLVGSDPFFKDQIVQNNRMMCPDQIIMGALHRIGQNIFDS